MDQPQRVSMLEDSGCIEEPVSEGRVIWQRCRHSFDHSNHVSSLCRLDEDPSDQEDKVRREIVCYNDNSS